MVMQTDTNTERVLTVGGSSGMGLALARLVLTEANEVTIVGRSERRLASATTSTGPSR